jgi:hypothetical protein
MLKRTIAVTMACALLILSAGCSSTGNSYQGETLLGRNWGRSVETAKHNQILDPEAGKSLKPVAGLSGEAAVNSVDKYEKSFKEKATEQSTTTTTIQK